MSTYTISLKSIINIHSHINNNDDVFNNTPLKIERGREVLFNYEYEGKNNKEFSDLFETSFIINYLTRDIYCDDIELFKLTLQNDVKIKSKLFYQKWFLINEELKNISDKLGVIEAESETKSENNNKSLNSQFPFDIKKAEDFGDVKHMDSGAMATGNGKANGYQKSTEYNSKLVHAKELLEIQSVNVINDFVKSLNDCFIGLY